MKKIAMIPILLGSTRIPDKNLLLVDGKPMAHYVLKACIESDAFDEIYINSEHEIFESMAKEFGVRFYRRDPSRGGSACTMVSKSRQCASDRCQTHDHFLYDFMKNMSPCLLSLVHTTSPLLQPLTIAEFMNVLETENYDSLFSTSLIHAETFFSGRPLNFSPSVKVPTQSLQPVQIISWGLSAWRSSTFMASYEADKSDENGPTFCGKSGTFPIDLIQALDVDTWQDLEIVEACLQHRRLKTKGTDRESRRQGLAGAKAPDACVSRFGPVGENI